MTTEKDNQDLIEQAIKDEKDLTFDYQDARGNLSHRNVLPKEIKYGKLYCNDYDKKALRSFKIEHISNIKIIDRKPWKPEDDIPF